MAIATGTALLGAAALGAGGSILAANSQKKAAGKAADISAQAARENNALTREIYNLNTANFQPWMQSGLAANSMINSALGLPSAPPAQSAFAPPTAQPAQPQMMSSEPPADFWPYDRADMYGKTPQQAWGIVQSEGRMAPAGNPSAFAADPRAPAPPIAATPQAFLTSPRSAFDTFKASTGYDFRFNEGLSAIQKGFGRNLESGAATKAALRFGQGIASDEYGRWMDLLRGQQQLGFGGASALAGVGQNFVSNTTANNNSAASAAANARLYAGQAGANMWGSIGSSFGNALGQMPGAFGTVRF